MRKSLTGLAILLVLGLIVGGTGFAADPDSMASPEKARVEGQDKIELTGTILSDNTFIDENGEQYQLAESDKSEELKSVVGEKIKVTASVMENDEGAKSLAISKYELVPE